ncbi:hypothetical protein EON80_09035 [bacterium]|nr:MAG: hypothetical protein EON80_09035 [bacterium]
MKSRFLPLTLATLAVVLTGTSSMRNAMAQQANVVVDPANAGPTIEIEAQYIAVSADVIKQLGIVAAPQPGDIGSLQRGIIKPTNKETPNGTLLQLINPLLTQNVAKLLTAPRIRTVSNRQAELRSFTDQPAYVGVFTKDNFEPVIDPTQFFNQSDPSMLSVGSGYGFTATPTLNPDQTINLKINPGAVTRLTFSKKSAGDQLPTVLMESKSSGEQVLANLKDGETVALLGGDSLLLNPNLPKGVKPQNIVVLVTVRKVKP